MNKFILATMQKPPALEPQTQVQVTEITPITPVKSFSRPHPVQDLHLDETGVVRFRENKIVDDLLEFATPRGFDLNHIARSNYSRHDQVQFAQLIGYSLGGFSELQRYVTDEDYAVAEAKYKSNNNLSEVEQLEVRNKTLRTALKDLRQGVMKLADNIPWDQIED